MSRLFLLSPASCEGRRAAMLLSERASFDLAVRLRTPAGASLGEVFSFLSGLYFRGKLAYAAAFSRPALDVPGALVITSCRGLLPPETIVTADDLRAFATVDIDESNPRYREPLARDARSLAHEIEEVILLGSIATRKYVEPLGEAFGDRLRFPTAFVGRGDMSRGGLMLRAVASGVELETEPIGGVIRHGARPPKLEPKTAAAPTPRRRSSRSRRASRP